MADEDNAGLDQLLTSSDQIDRGSSGLHPAYIGQLEGADGFRFIKHFYVKGGSCAVDSKRCL